MENKEDKDEIVRHFNQLIDGEEDLGSVLFSGYNEVDQFTSRVKFLDDELLKIYTDELLN